LHGISSVFAKVSFCPWCSLVFLGWRLSANQSSFDEACRCLVKHSRNTAGPKYCGVLPCLPNESQCSFYLVNLGVRDFDNSRLGRLVPPIMQDGKPRR